MRRRRSGAVSAYADQGDAQGCRRVADGTQKKPRRLSRGRWYQDVAPPDGGTLSAYADRQDAQGSPFQATVSTSKLKQQKLLSRHSLSR
jgi:hypothetical protein